MLESVEMINMLFLHGFESFVSVLVFSCSRPLSFFLKIEPYEFPFKNFSVLKKIRLEAKIVTNILYLYSSILKGNQSESQNNVITD